MRSVADNATAFACGCVRAKIAQRAPWHGRRHYRNRTRLCPVISAGCGNPISASTRRREIAQRAVVQRRAAADVDQRHRPDRVLRMRHAVVVEHLFEIAVVGGDQHLAAALARCARRDRAERDVDRLGGLDRRRLDAAVADHVRVGDVADDEVELLRRDRRRPGASVTSGQLISGCRS